MLNDSHLIKMYTDLKIPTIREDIIKNGIKYRNKTAIQSNKCV